MPTVGVTISSAASFPTKAVSVAYTFLGEYSWLEVDEGTVNLTGRAGFKKPGVYEVILRAASSDERERCLYVGKARTVLGRRIVEKLVHGKSMKDHPYTQLVLADAEEAARARSKRQARTAPDQMLRVRDPEHPGDVTAPLA
jgi:hypothetical protein